MPGALDGRTVAITEHRFEKEFRRLLERLGARVVSCPLLEEHPVENHAELGRFIDRVVAGELDAMVFFTGVGVRFLAAEAESAGRLKAFLDALEKLTVVARGPKPRAALQKLGRSVDRAPEKPTSEGLLEMFAGTPTNGKRVGVQLYGKPNPDFVSGLEAMGAVVSTVQVYDYAPASDRDRLSEFIRTLLKDEIDVLTITSAPQVASLFGVADVDGVSEELADRLNGRVAVAVIGEVADRALRRRRITARICPESPKMARLVEAIADHFTGASA